MADAVADAMADAMTSTMARAMAGEWKTGPRTRGKVPLWGGGRSMTTTSPEAVCVHLRGWVL